MVAIYARQSIYKEDSLSIDGQIEQCKKHLLNDEPYSVYKDPGYSGKDTNRPDYERMVRDIEKGLIHKIIVYKLDRITRSILDFTKMMEMFKKHNITFLSCSESFDTSQPMGKTMLYIIAAFAEMERDNIIKRVTDNYHQRAKQGFYTSGPAPFGFKLEKTIHLGKKTSILIPDEKEISTVIELFNRYAYDETISLNKLSIWLNDNRIWTSNNKPWTNSSISKLLANPIYVKSNADIYTYLHDIKGATMNNDVSEYVGTYGCYVYLSNKTKDRQRTKCSDLSNSSVTLALHEGVIDPDTWLKCQHRLDMNKPFEFKKGEKHRNNNSARNGKGVYSWLSGLMKCGYCGYAIMAVNNKVQNKTYINCGGRKRGAEVCQGRQRTIYIYEIEDIVQPLLMERFKHLKEIEVSELKQDSRRVNEIKIKLVEIDQRISNLVESLAEMSGAAVTVINQKINKECQKREELAEELEDAMAEQQKQDYSRIDIDDCINNWDTFDIEKKKGIARIFIEKVIVTDDEIVPVFK